MAKRKKRRGQRKKLQTGKNLTIHDLRKEIERRRKALEKKIAGLKNRRKKLLGQLARIEENIQPLLDEIGGKRIKGEGKPKERRGRKRITGRRVRRRARGKLKPGFLKKAILGVMSSMKGIVSPREIQQALLKQGIYRKVPRTLPRMIHEKLKGPEFKHLGKGKYTLAKR